ncbi:hypothetical protein JMJ77_0006377, partial [Colletotrichum scovillei]
ESLYESPVPVRYQGKSLPQELEEVLAIFEYFY